MNKEEAELKATELVTLSLQAKEIKEKIDLLKAELLEFTEIENISDTVWQADNGYVEVKTETKYKLADIPSDFKVSTDIVAIDVAEKAFENKIVLSKEGKQLFKEKYPSIVKLMIPTIKKNIKITI